MRLLVCDRAVRVSAARSERGHSDLRAAAFDELRREPWAVLPPFDHDRADPIDLDVARPWTRNLPLRSRRSIVNDTPRPLRTSRIFVASPCSSCWRSSALTLCVSRQCGWRPQPV